AYVIFGRGIEQPPGPASIDTEFLSATQGFRLVLSGSNLGDIDGFAGGFAVSSAGDFNGDGFDDVMVTSPGAGGDERGATYIVFGKAGGFADGTLATTARSDWIRIYRAPAPYPTRP